MRFVIKSIQDNDVTNHTSAVYVKNDIELLGLIGPGTIYDKTRQDNDVIDLPHVVYA